MANAGGAGVWEIGGASARGTAHVRKGLGNQDAILWAPENGPSDTIIVAVSDGHGSKEHFRSDSGSRLAVEAAVATLGDFVSRFKAAESPAITTAAIEIPTQIHRAWRTRVDADLAATPLENARLAKGEDRFVPYGATLVAAAAAPHFILLVQIGDGDLTVGFTDGRLTRPLPDDAGLVGEQTYSLCDPEAARANRFRLQVLPVPGTGAELDFLMLSTDGLSKSCPDERAFMKLAAEWRSTLRRGDIDGVTGSLESWLGDASARGSGDDITLGFAVRKAPTSRVPAAAVVPGLPASLERRIWLATTLSYLALGISVFTLLILGVLWWTSAPKPPAPPPKAEAPAKVEQPKVEPSSQPRQTAPRSKNEGQQSDPGVLRQQSLPEAPEGAKPPN